MQEMNENIPIIEIKKVTPPLKNMPKIVEYDLKIKEDTINLLKQIKVKLLQYI